MRSFVSPLQPCRNQQLHQPGQFVTFYLGEVGPLVLGEQGQQVQRHQIGMKIVDHPDTAALAPALPAPAQLPYPARAFHDVVGLGVGSQIIHDFAAFRFAQKLLDASGTSAMVSAVLF